MKQFYLIPLFLILSFAFLQAQSPTTRFSEVSPVQLAGVILVVVQ